LASSEFTLPLFDCLYKSHVLTYVTLVSISSIFINFETRIFQKADLIGGRTSRKPINSAEVKGGVDEQTYYEFDLAFAPLECPDFMEGNKENLGLGFCPYDKIFLISATVLKNSETDKSGTLMCCVVECDKAEWKLGNSDIKRVRSSFNIERA